MQALKDVPKSNHLDSSAQTGVVFRVQAIVNRIVAKRVPGAVVVTASQALSEAGLTSLDMVNLMLALEEEFDLFVPQAQMLPDNFRSVKAIVALMEGLLSQ